MIIVTTAQRRLFQFGAVLGGVAQYRISAENLNQWLHRRVYRVVRYRTPPAFIVCLLIFPLLGCVAPLVPGVSNLVLTEVAPRAINGKGLAEDGADAVTGKDCRLVEGLSRKDRKICETRNSRATRKDFKGLAGSS